MLSGDVVTPVGMLMRGCAVMMSGGLMIGRGVMMVFNRRMVMMGFNRRTGS
jgi:hypothetical protein